MGTGQQTRRWPRLPCESRARRLLIDTFQDAMVKRDSPGLWQHADFLKLWAGQGVSLFGDQVRYLALPLTAVLLLNASPAEMGLLQSAAFAPYLLFSLVAGVWIDRVRRRPVLLATNVGRALLIGSIPLGALLGGLRIELLYVVAFASGTLATCFESAYHAYLPTLIGRSRLIEGNSKLGVSGSLASVVGPGLGGMLVQALTAPIALVVDALSFVMAAGAFWRIRTEEPSPATPRGDASFWSELRAGIGVVGRDPLLRATTASAATGNLFANVMYAVYVVYLVRELRLDPVTIGLIYSVGSIGGLLGALIAGPCSRRLGVGRTVIVAALLMGVGSLLVPAATGPSMVVAAMLATGRALVDLGAAISNVNVISLRAVVTPDHLLGRVDASVRVVTAGAMGVGPLIGGALGEMLGLWPTLVVGAVGSLLAVGWLIWSPVRALHEQPRPVASPG